MRFPAFAVSVDGEGRPAVGWMLRAMAKGLGPRKLILTLFLSYAVRAVLASTFPTRAHTGDTAENRSHRVRETDVETSPRRTSCPVTALPSRYLADPGENNFNSLNLQIVLDKWI